MYTHIYMYIDNTSPARVRDGPFQTGCSRATVLCLSSFGGGDLPSSAEGMKTCAGSRRLLLRRERWGRVLRTVHPLELGWSTIPSPSAHPPCSPRPPASVIVEGDTVPGCTPRTLSLSQCVEVRASYTSTAYIHSRLHIHVHIYIYVYIDIYTTTPPPSLGLTRHCMYVLPGSLCCFRNPSNIGPGQRPHGFAPFTSREFFV